MSALALVLAVFARGPAENRQDEAARVLAAATRYSMSAFGPIGVSGAHFIAALIFLHTLSRNAFGLFSFLLVVAPFALSICGAFFSPPIARTAAVLDGADEAVKFTLFKTSAVFSAAATLVIAVLMAMSGASAGLAAMFGLYGGVMALRWFARCWAYAKGRIARVLSSDLVYSGVLVAALAALVALRQLTMNYAAATLLASAVAGLLVFDLAHLRDHFRALKAGRLGPFAQIWRDMSGWAVMGVVLSEATVNAHSYLVTFISGPHAFAVLAVGALLMRPVSLVLAALPDMERPLMSRNIAAQDLSAAFRIVKEFRTAAGAIWFATIALAGVLLTWFPHLLLKKEYALGDVLVVVALSAAIMSLRAWRTPESVLLQAAGEFRKLAGASMWSSVVSLVATFALLIAIGPLAALAGVLLGEMVATQRIFAIARTWKHAHG
jgi:O-antigen/teichoic acid export membrane protein